MPKAGPWRVMAERLHMSPDALAFVLAVLYGSDFKHLVVFCATPIGLILAATAGTSWIITSFKSGERRELYEDRADRAEDERAAMLRALQQGHIRYIETTDTFLHLAGQLAHLASQNASVDEQAVLPDDLLDGEVAAHLKRIISEPGDCTAADAAFLQHHWSSDWCTALTRDGDLTLEQVMAFARTAPFEVNAILFKSLPSSVDVPDNLSALGLTDTGYIRVAAGTEQT